MTKPRLAAPSGVVVIKREKVLPASSRPAVEFVIVESDCLYLLLLYRWQILFSDMISQVMVSQDDSSLLHRSNKRFSQITTEVLGQSDFANGQEGSRALIDNTLQTNGLFTPPQSNYTGHFSNHLLLQQSLNAGASADRRHTSNDQETFLTFSNDDLQINELSTISPRHQPSYLEDFLGHTLSEQSADAAACSQGSYPVNNQHSSLADRGNALQHPPSSDLNHLGYFPNYTLKQSASATSYPQCSSPANNQETFLAFVEVVPRTSGFAPAPPQPNHPEDFLNYTLSEQYADAAAYSQCSYPINDPQTTLTDLKTTDTLAESVGRSSIIIPLSLALTEHQHLAQNFEQYPFPWLPNIEHQPGSPSASMALVNQSLALNRRQNPYLGCRLQKIKVFSLTL